MDAALVVVVVVPAVAGAGVTAANVPLGGKVVEVVMVVKAVDVDGVLAMALFVVVVMAVVVVGDGAGFIGVATVIGMATGKADANGFATMPFAADGTTATVVVAVVAFAVGSDAAAKLFKDGVVGLVLVILVEEALLLVGVECDGDGDGLTSPSAATAATVATVVVLEACGGAVTVVVAIAVALVAAGGPAGCVVTVVVDGMTI